MEFESHPWLLIPLIVLTAEAWGLLKMMVRSWYGRRGLRNSTTD